MNFSGSTPAKFPARIISNICSGVFILLKLWASVPYLGFQKGGHPSLPLFSSHLSLTFPILPFLYLSPSLPLPRPPLSPAFSLIPCFPFPPFLRSRPLKSSQGVWGSAVSSPSGVWDSLSRNQIWCILGGIVSFAVCKCCYNMCFN